MNIFKWRITTTDKIEQARYTEERLRNSLRISQRKIEELQEEATKPIAQHIDKYAMHKLMEAFEKEFDVALSKATAEPIVEKEFGPSTIYRNATLRRYRVIIPPLDFQYVTSEREESAG